MVEYICIILLTHTQIGGTSHVTNEYELHLVGGTNIYVIVKKQDFNKDTCSCPVSGFTNISVMPM